VAAALADERTEAELTIRIVGEREARRLNARWRGKDYATNVLSFPVDGLGAVVPHYLGDIVICAAVVQREAHAQGKLPEAHWAHLVVHGVFHLLGFDHEQETDAEIMEQLESATLLRLGYRDPYLEFETL
jgi:probable rRNA maturation factor